MCGAEVLLITHVLASTFVSEDVQEPFVGVVVRQQRWDDPDNDVFVAEIDLCAAGISVLATEAPSSRQTAGAWAEDVGAQLAVNGDFYSSTSVYGDAVGGGERWPLDQLGVDDDTLALVSGFPQLVYGGEVYTCVSPTDSDCFPDRSDMRDRHPRTAMWLSVDRRTLIFAVVDGRSTRSSGMYGAELAELMGALGAWQAFNLDGGGSSTFWVEGSGALNEPSDGSMRSVANHWGVVASGSGEAGHCLVEEGCFALPVDGAGHFADMVDDDEVLAVLAQLGPRGPGRSELHGRRRDLGALRGGPAGRVRRRGLRGGPLLSRRRPGPS